MSAIVKLDWERAAPRGTMLATRTPAASARDQAKGAEAEEAGTSVDAKAKGNMVTGRVPLSKCPMVKPCCKLAGSAQIQWCQGWPGHPLATLALGPRMISNAVLPRFPRLSQVFPRKAKLSPIPPAETPPGRMAGANPWGMGPFPLTALAG